MKNILVILSFIFIFIIFNNNSYGLIEPNNESISSNSNYTKISFKNETNLLDSNMTTTNNKIISLNLSPITDGSQIKTSSLEFFVIGYYGDTCKIYTKDPVIDYQNITNNFSCYGKQIIPINQAGVFALQNNLRTDSLNIVIKNEYNQSLSFENMTLKVKYVLPQYFAEIDENNKVINVIIADQTFINTLEGKWIETKIDGSIRGNYAKIGSVYDPIRDQFYSIQPYPSWSLNSTGQWNAPIPYPNDGIMHFWNETTKTWN